MKKHGYIYYFLVLVTVITVMIISSAFNIFESEKEPIIVQTKNAPEPIWNKDLILEKEVVVYVEKESEPEPVEVVEEYQETIVHYYQQPLDYNFDVTIPSGYTTDDLYRSLGGIRKGIEDVVPAVVEAEQTYGINSLYLLAALGYESGWGEYESGYNNIAGWKGNGGYWSDFSSRYECVMTVANGLANDFVHDVGSDIYSVTQRYTPDEGYVDVLLQIMNQLQNNI